MMANVTDLQTKYSKLAQEYSKVFKTQLTHVHYMRINKTTTVTVMHVLFSFLHWRESGVAMHVESLTLSP